MKILCLNCGSSSVNINYMPWKTRRSWAEGRVERIGQDNAVITHQSTGKEKVSKTMPILEHTVAIRESLNLLTHPEHGVISSVDEIDE